MKKSGLIVAGERMKNKKEKLRFLKYFLLLFSFAGVLTHYVENYELVFAKKIRSLLYFGTLNHINVDQFSGVVMKNYKEASYSQVSPVDVVQYIFADIHTVLQNQIGKIPGMEMKTDIDSDKIMHTADFLLNFAEEEIINDLIVYLYPYKFDYDDLKAPWYSCMAQAHVTELMLAAYELSGDKKYYDAAEYSLNYIRLFVSDGGGTIKVNGGLWYEEYVYPSEFQCAHVLNGHLFVLDALYWLKYYSEDWKDFYALGYNAVISNLLLYDSFGWSWYDCNKVLANGTYHRLHIDQLERLNVLYPNKILEKYILRFKLYQYIPLGVFQRLIIMHNRMLFFLVIINMSFFVIVFFLIKCVCHYFCNHNIQEYVLG